MTIFEADYDRRGALNQLRILPPAPQIARKLLPLPVEDKFSDKRCLWLGCFS